jgi:hypothetical protein
MKNELTFERVNELLRYEHETGKLYWSVSRGGVMAGSEAGYDKADHRTTYRIIGIDGKRYWAHRIVWLLHYGEWPKGEIDHIDGGGLNNRICNLRDVTRTTNQRNRRMQRNNTSGINGVSWHKARGKWYARSVDTLGQQRYLGIFADLSDAENTVREFRAKHGFTDRHGDAR